VHDGRLIDKCKGSGCHHRRDQGYE